jgi:hypothetical protein
MEEDKQANFLVKAWNWLWGRKWAIWLVIPLWLFFFIWWEN